MDPGRITDRDRILSKSHVQALAEFIPSEKDGARRVAPLLLDEEGGPSRTLADGHPRVVTVRGPGDEGSQAASESARGDLLIHLGRVGNDHGWAGHVGIAPSTGDRARGPPLCLRLVVSSRAGEGRNLAPQIGRRRLKGGDIRPLTPSGNECLDAPGQPAVVVNRRVRAPADKPCGGSCALASGRCAFPGA